MATQSSSAGKSAKSSDSKRESTGAKATPAAEIAVEAPVETSLTKDVAETPAEAAPKTPAVEPPKTPALVAPAYSEDFVSATFKFDSADWTKQTFELWSENASAFLDLVEQIAKAKTLDEIISLQSRFATERLDRFMRQSQDWMSFAQSFTSVTTAPFYGARAA